HDVCLQNLDVVFCIDRAGLVGEDGETHQGLFDIAFMSHMPNMTVLSPANYNELSQMLDYSINKHKGPVAIRYPRGNMQFVYENAKPFVLGKADVIYGGNDAAILFAGHMGKIADEARAILKEKGINVSLINLRTIFPIEKAMLEKLLENIKICVVLEDGVERGGVGEYVSSLLSDSDKNIIIKAHKNGVVQHGSVNELYKLCGLDAEQIAKDILMKLEKTDE
ncbi:MAG: 1-deoxy-D-xylulose-5-phosphate synthase, partial [Clostridia bacterium]|nr:1-deoxy-D-xylulose-5-phosphate synthase [Clostridia bacterium]